MLFCHALLNAQLQAGKPVITNYLPKEYKAHNQNWAITTDKHGIMYFGNSTGVLEFDGYSWNVIKVPNEIVRSLAVDDKGTVFVGSADDFGYLARKKNGTLEFKSLLGFTKVNGAIGHVWYTFNIKGRIFFITDNYIFSFHFDNNSYSNPKVKTWISEERFRIAHKVFNDLYVLETARGMLKFNGDSFDLIPGSDIFTETTVYAMLPYDRFSQKILLVARKLGMFIYDGKEFIKFKTEADEFLGEKGVYLPGAKLPDGNFVINTSTKGIAIIDQYGKLERIINANSGIADDGVLYTLYTKGKLWLALQNGISSVELPSKVHFLNQNDGLKGSISDIIVRNDLLYAASTAGIFKLNLNVATKSDKKFSIIPQIVSEGWWFSNHRDGLLTATTDGIYFINERSVNKLNKKWSRPYVIYQSKVFPNRFYVGTETGLAVLEEIYNVWNDRGKLGGVDVSIRSIGEDSYGNLWLGTIYNGVYKVSNVSSDLRQTPKIENISDKHITPNGAVQLFPINDELLFATAKEVLIYNNETHSFEREKKYGLNESLNGYSLACILQDNNGTIWLAAIKGTVQLKLASVSWNGTNYEWRDLSFLKTVIDFSNSHSVYKIFKDEKTQIIWFCGADGIVSYNAVASSYPSNEVVDNPRIRQITVNNDSLLFWGDDAIASELGIKNQFKIPADVYALRFVYSSLAYDNKLSEYQYKLDGFDKDWSNWSTENKKDYTNLSAGDYVFRIKAKNIYGSISSESTFTFTILAPWYFSWYAYLFYAGLLVLLIYLTIKFRFAYLIKKNLKLEAIVEDRTKVISSQAEKLKELDELKSRFFANISHEFRTPLTLILGRVKRVIEQTKESSTKDELGIVDRNANKLLELVNQILDISKLESGKMKLEAMLQNIVSVVESQVLAFSSYAERKKINLSFNASEKEIFIYFDKNKTEKVLINILSNAFKFTPQLGSILVNVSKVGNFVNISISDSGIGIPRMKIPKIFDRFYQVNGSQTREQEGTGIGLALTKELVELHKGKIEVESEEGRGTKFIVKLPLGSNHLKPEEIIEARLVDTYSHDKFEITEPVETEHKTLETEILFDDSKPMLLVVDDNDDIRKFIRDSLENDFKIIEAGDGETGLSKCFENIPELVISDVMMPKLDGYEMCEKLKSDERTSHIPVILLTAKAASNDKITGYETGADDYITKPFEVRELKARIYNLLEQRQRIRNHFKEKGGFDFEQTKVISLDKKFIQRTTAEINSNLGDASFGVEKLAENLAVTRFVLHKKLVSLTGESPVELIRRLRLVRAAELIRQKSANISEIALEVGFNNPAYFSDCFKKQYGVTPTQFQKKN